MTVEPWVQKRTETYDRSGQVVAVEKRYSNGLTSYSNNAPTIRRADVYHDGSSWVVECYEMEGFVMELGHRKHHRLTRGCKGRATNYAHNWVRG